MRCHLQLLSALLVLSLLSALVGLHGCAQLGPRVEQPAPKCQCGEKCSCCPGCPCRGAK